MLTFGNRLTVTVCEKYSENSDFFIQPTYCNRIRHSVYGIMRIPRKSWLFILYGGNTYMILHQNNHFIYNNQVAFTLPNGICFNFHPDTTPWEDGFQFIAPDNSFQLMLTFLTTDKSAETFATEVYEEYENTTIFEPAHPIITPHGLHGYATVFALTQEIVEELTIDLPGECHSLLHVRFWRRKGAFDETLYASVRAEVLNGIRSYEPL